MFRFTQKVSKTRIQRFYSLKNNAMILQYERLFETKTEENEMNIEFLNDLKIPFVVFSENESIKPDIGIFNEFKKKYPLSEKKITKDQFISQERYFIEN
jgi:hypothetical protein